MRVVVVFVIQILFKYYNRDCKVEVDVDVESFEIAGIVKVEGY